MSNTDGSKNSFYDIPDWVCDADDLIEHLRLSFDEGNIMKSLWCKLGDRHKGTNPVRDARKGLHYSERRLDRYLKAEEEIEANG